MQWTWIVLIVIVVGYFLWSRSRGGGVQQLDSASLQERLNDRSSSLQVIDVREPHEFKGGHIPVAKNIPLGRLGERLGDIPSDKDVVFVCRSGNRSMMAARKAQKAGLKSIYNLRGGMSSWKGAVKK